MPLLMNIFRLRLVGKVQSLKSVNSVDIGKVSQILAIRQQAIGGLVDCAHRCIDKYSDPYKTVCNHQGLEGLCDSTTLGYLTRAFKRAKIYPEASSLMNMSLVHIKSLIAGIRINPIPDLYSGKVEPGCCSSPKQNIFNCSRCSKSLEFFQCGSCKEFYFGGSCYTCHKTYKAVTLPTNHLSCIPLIGVKAEMDAIIDKITGLQYSDFLRSSTKDRQTITTHPGPDATDLWETLVFQ